MLKNPITCISLLVLGCSLAASLITVADGNAQQLFEENLDRSCSYGGEDINEDIYTFTSPKEAWQIITKITEVVGLKPNFDVRAANVPNAAAVIYGTQRLVLYSQHFIRKILDQTRTDWAGISILAHEIGHHLQGHTLQPGGSRPPIELEADEFSGFVVGLLGGSLDDATVAMRTLASPSGSATHPPKSARVEAIAVGWDKAREQRGGSAETVRRADPARSDPPTARLPAPGESQPSPAPVRFQTVAEAENYLIGKWCMHPSERQMKLFEEKLAFLEKFPGKFSSCTSFWKIYERHNEQLYVQDACAAQWTRPTIDITLAGFNEYIVLSDNSYEYRSERDPSVWRRWERCR